MKATETLKIIASAVLMSTLIACASKPKNYTALPADADPNAEIEVVRKDLQQARAAQVDVLAPESYDKAREAFDDAITARSKNKSNTKVLEQVAISKAYLETAQEKSRVNRAAFEPMLGARKAALEAKADTLAKKTFDRADKKLSDLTDRAERGDLSRIDRSREAIISDYQTARAEAVSEEMIGGSRKAMNKAIDEGAKRYAPKTLESVNKQIDELASSIRHDPTPSLAMTRAARATEMQANRLLGITRMSKLVQSRPSEDVALLIEDRDNRLQALQMRSTVQERSLARRGEALERTSRELAAAEKSMEPQKAYEEIRAQFNPNEADVFMEGNKVVVRMKSLNFASNKAEIPTAQFGSLKKLGESIKNVGASKVTVEGHTDAVGSAQVNKDLSQRRAVAVEDYLTANSEIAKDKVDAVGYGYSKPISDNKTKEGRAQNRRIDVVIEL